MKKDWMIKESELDDDQIKVLTATLDKSCVISGCAGSGKSVLALIKAQRIQKERGDNYEIIVYTKALCHYMNSGREELGLTKPFYYHWQWKNRHRCTCQRPGCQFSHKQQDALWGTADTATQVFTGGHRHIFLQGCIGAISCQTQCQD